MTQVKIGTAVSVIGYGLAIWGGWVLYRNAAPDAFGLIPVSRPGEDAPTMFARQEQERAQRASRNAFGFAMLTVGSSFQLIGTALAGFSN
jgi:hypothetical protein